MRAPAALLAAVLMAIPAAAQEKEDHASAFALVQGGAVYDEKDGIDGSLVSESYQLTHLTCSVGSSKIRLLMPVSKDTVDRQVTTLRQIGGKWRIDIKASGKVYRKDVVFKPVRDPKSEFSEQPEITITVGDPLWTALIDPSGDKFWALTGEYGTNVYIVGGPAFRKFLAACAIAAK